MNARYSLGLLVAAVVLLIGGSSDARADWYFRLVRITCVPAAAYASVETFGVYNIDGDAWNYLNAQGIYELGTLASAPFMCDLPAGKLMVKVVNYHPAQPTGQCGGVEDGDLIVSLQGNELTTAKSTHGGCQGSQRHDIRISQYGLQHCIISFDEATQTVSAPDFSDVKAVCKSVPIPPN